MKNDRYNRIYIGIVKSNEDFQNMGRLSVQISELTTIDASIVVSYASPFIGSSNPDDVDQDNTETFEGTQTSYGFWAVPPTINSQVLVAFVNGEPSRGYWFACLPQPFMNHMLPNIPVGDTYQYEGDEDVPVAEFNRANTSPNKHKGKRPYHKTHYVAIRNQGLKKDKVRGFSQHGATSKKPSSVTGLLSPKGHYWSIEDTDNDEKIRIRTKSGVQLLLDDTNGLVYVINKSGSGWVEVDDTGKIMVYGESGIAFRTKGDFSVRADKDIIFESGRNTYIHSNGDIKYQTNNIINNAKGAFIINAIDDVSVIGSNLDIDISGHIKTMSSELAMSSSGNIDFLAGGDGNIGATNINIGANANATISGNAQASLSGNSSVTVASGGVLGLGGSVINMNMGAAFIGAGSASSSSPTTIVPDDFVMLDKVDVFQPPNDDEPTVEAFPTIVTTLPTHEPCQEHDVSPSDLG